MIWRVLGGISGVGVLGAATQLNVAHAGGYASSDAPLIIAAAVLPPCRDGGLRSRHDGRAQLGALALGLCGSPARGRELAAREAVALPVAEAAAKREAAQKRLTDAEAAKKKANDVSEAAKRDCRTDCAALLQVAKRDAENELTAARKALEDLPAVGSATPLADRLGLAAWAWDLIVAGLRSLLVIGGSLAIALALHPKRAARRSVAERPATRARSEPVREPAPLLIAAPVNPREHVSRFLRPDPAAATSWSAAPRWPPETATHRSIRLAQCAASGGGLPFHHLTSADFAIPMSSALM